MSWRIDKGIYQAPVDSTYCNTRTQKRFDITRQLLETPEELVAVRLFQTQADIVLFDYCLMNIHY